MLGCILQFFIWVYTVCQCLRLCIQAIKLFFDLYCSNIFQEYFGMKVQPVLQQLTWNDSQSHLDKYGYLL